MQPILIILLILCVGALLLVIILLNKSTKKSQSNTIVHEEKNLELRKTFHKIDEKNGDYESSIQYAKRLVDAIFKIGALVQFDKLDYFLLYRPKDIISGDFVWHISKYDRHYFAVADCTGHGVPGAFMSIISYNLLNQAVNEHGYSKPSEILEYMNRRHFEIFNEKNINQIRDGMDIGICVVDTDSEIVEFAGAMRPMYRISANGEFEKIRGDRTSIGDAMDRGAVKFKDHFLELSEGDTIYLTSDGYVDQFGGLEGKKFKNRKFNSILSEMSKNNMKEQHKKLNFELSNWMKEHEQNDDITVLGIRFCP